MKVEDVPVREFIAALMEYGKPCDVTTGAIGHALAAVIPAIQNAALERAAVVAKAHFPPECPVHNPNDEWAKGYNEALRAICPNVVAAIRALKEET